MGLLGFYFLPSGRIARSSFWLGLLGLILIEVAFNLWLDMTLFGYDFFDPKAGTLAKPAFQLGLLINLIFAFPLFVLLARRFHDRNKGAIWALPFLLAYIAAIGASVLGWVGLDTPPTPPGLVIGMVETVLLFWILIELGCLRGTPGANRYGADPLAK